MTAPDGRPDWARRIREEREARGWNKSQFVEALRAHADRELPAIAILARESSPGRAGPPAPTTSTSRSSPRPSAPSPGRSGPARAAGTPTPSCHGAGMDTLEVLTRLRASTVDAATLESLRITVDRLCSEYPHLPAEQLLVEGRPGCAGSPRCWTASSPSPSTASCCPWPAGSPH